jgi:hypothetical protein
LQSYILNFISSVAPAASPHGSPEIWGQTFKIHLTRNSSLLDFVKKYAVLIQSKNSNFKLFLGLRESVELALQDFAQRKIISNHKEISVRRPEIINYYANTIAHHFESKLDSGNEKYLPDVQSVIYKSRF